MVHIAANFYGQDFLIKKLAYNSPDQQLVAIPTQQSFEFDNIPVQ